MGKIICVVLVGFFVWWLFMMDTATECKARWDGTFPAKYSAVGGCRINVPGEGWIEELKNTREN